MSTVVDKQEDTYVVLLHGIVKKSQKTPKEEIEKAKRIMNNYIKEHNDKGR